MSTALTLMLCVVIPVLHHFRFSNVPPSPLRACLGDVGITPEAHHTALSLYFRYEVEPKNECTFETRILRGCVEDNTARIGFTRYPPGPLRTKNQNDVYESFEYIERDLLGHDGGDGDECHRPGVLLANTLPRLMQAPYGEALRDISPFSSLHGDGDENATVSRNATLSFHDYACLAAAERGVVLIEHASAANNQQASDLSLKLAHFFTSPEFVQGGCYLFGEDCVGEKDTSEGETKGSDLGLGKCDFVEFADVA